MKRYPLSFDKYVKVLVDAGVNLTNEVRLKEFKQFMVSDSNKNPTVLDEERKVVDEYEGKVHHFKATYRNHTVNVRLRFNLTKEQVRMFDERELYMHTPWSWTYSLGDFSGSVHGAKTPQEAEVLVQIRLDELTARENKH